MALYILLFLPYIFFCFFTQLDLWLLHLDTFFCVIKDKRIGVMLAAIILFSNHVELQLSDMDPFVNNRLIALCLECRNDRTLQS